MADWTVTWKPDLGFRFWSEYDTNVTVFEDGGEQRRKKRTRPRYHFSLAFSNRAIAVVDAIMAFYKSKYGAYDTFSFPGYAQRIKGTRLACVNSDPDTITDSSSEFVTRGFDSDLDVWIEGSGAGNDGVYGVNSVAVGTITLDVAESLTAESANADLIVYPSYTVRFVADQFEREFITNDYSTVRIVELVEVI